MLDWAQQFSILLFLDNNHYSNIDGKYECLLAAGARTIVGDEPGAPLSQLKKVHQDQKDWLFGHICYDYKNFTEPKLTSGKPVKTGFPEIQFFVPQTVCYISRDCLTITIETFGNTDDVYNQLMNQVVAAQPQLLPALQFIKVLDRDSYLQTVQKLRTHIADGDCYEINFCNEGYCENAIVDPLVVFQSLNRLSPAPFAAYYRLRNHYLMSASPERYMRKSEHRLLSQPIKGTARRDPDAATDELIKKRLRNDIKEQAENVMITDLVRNDLARCCETGSINVEELFGIYTFPQVHQMISSISGTLKQDLHFTDALRCSFPMGSMTGAPKFKVMQLIEQYEQSRRELFSGTVGYISPDGDSDFNVIIRSLFYNADSRYLSYQTGGAITYDSDPTKEWDEMQLKAWALERIFAS